MKNPNNAKIFIGAILLVLLLIFLNNNFLGSPTDLMFSDDESSDLVVTGVNTAHAELIIPYEGEFTGSESDDFFGDNLFSFVNLKDSSATCTYKRSSGNEYALTSGTVVAPAASGAGGLAGACNVGEFVQFKWGSANEPWAGAAGTNIFGELWEINDAYAQFQFDNYFVTQHYPSSFTYECYACQTPSENMICSDTDGDNKDTAGTVHVVVQGTSGNYDIDTFYSDYCRGTTYPTVLEYTCGADGDVVALIRSCGLFEGCQNGACGGDSSSNNFACFENDGGKNYFKFSTNTLKQGVNTINQKSDYCVGDVLHEYFCTSSSASSISESTYDCPGGCANGRCLDETTITVPEEQEDEPTTVTVDPCAKVACVGGDAVCITSDDALGEVFDVCSSNEICQDSGNSAQCVSQTITDDEGCSSDTDCVVGEECVSGVCKTISYNDCVDQACVGFNVVCVDSNSQYGEVLNYCDDQGYVCVAGSCVPSNNPEPECSVNADCSVEKPYCEAGGCVACVSNGDCFRPNSVMECLSGTCINQGPRPVITPVVDDEDVSVKDNSWLIIGGLVLVIGSVIYFTRFYKPKKKKKTFFKPKRR